MIEGRWSGKILIVDDMPASIDLLRSILEEEGYHVFVVNSGKKAINRAERIAPQLILLDILMPDMDGFETCRQLKEQAATKDIPVIFMSALKDPDEKVKRFDLGAVDYVTKPIETQELMARVRTQIKIGRLQHEFKKLNVGLEKRVADRTASLYETNLALKAEIDERIRTEQALLKSEKQLRALSQRLAEVEEDERKQLARELHDRVGQNLTALNLNLNLIFRKLSDDSKQKIAERFDDAIGLVEETAGHIRDVMSELRPHDLDDYGLLAALQWEADRFAARSQIQVEVVGEALSPRPSRSLETALFRIAQEALTNIAKHARAGQVTIALKATKNSIQLAITDDGIGFDVNKLKGGVDSGWGLILMQERAQSKNGRLHVISKPDEGTRVLVELKR